MIIIIRFARLPLRRKKTKKTCVQWLYRLYRAIYLYRDTSSIHICNICKHKFTAVDRNCGFKQHSRKTNEIPNSIGNVQKELFKT